MTESFAVRRVRMNDADRVRSIRLESLDARAQRAYLRLGFAPTGGTSDGPNGTEFEMVMKL